MLQFTYFFSIFANKITAVEKYNPIKNLDERMIRADIPVKTLCERAGVNHVTFYRWLKNPPNTLVLIGRLTEELEAVEAERGIKPSTKLCSTCGAVSAINPVAEKYSTD